MNSNALEKVLIQGDLSQLSESDRIAYYSRVCESLGLNPLTQPFAYIRLNGKLKLYALREATEQLRRLHSVSVQIVSRELVEEIYVVTARATLPDGRCDESIGAVFLGQAQGEARANLLMKAESKAKRRVTLSLCGLAVLDEMEVETIPGAKKQQVPELPPALPEIYRTWKSPTDALDWGATILPELTPEELQQLFDSVLAVNGKKAPAFVQKVLSIATTS